MRNKGKQKIIIYTLVLERKFKKFHPILILNFRMGTNNVLVLFFPSNIHMFIKMFFSHNTKQYLDAKIYHRFKVKILFVIPSLTCLTFIYRFNCNTLIMFTMYLLVGLQYLHLISMQLSSFGAIPTSILW
jgi:hypothetical protein